MAQVTLDIAGRRYELTVREGQEAHFRSLGAIVDTKVRAVSAAMGTINESRQLLMAALLMADEIGGEPAAPPPAPAPIASQPSVDEVAVVRHIDALSDRIERLAQKLEMSAQHS